MATLISNQDNNLWSFQSPEVNPNDWRSVLARHNDIDWNNPAEVKAFEQELAKLPGFQGKYYTLDSITPSADEPAPWDWHQYDVPLPTLLDPKQAAAYNPNDAEPLTPIVRKYAAYDPSRDNLSIVQRQVPPYTLAASPFDEEDGENNSDLENGENRYNQLWKDYNMDRHNAMSRLRYAPIFGSLFEMNNPDNQIDSNPYEQLYWNTLSRSRVSADPPIAPVRYARYDPNAQAARQMSALAQANRSIQQSYAGRPGLAAGALANLFMRGNEQAGEAFRQGQLYNNNVAQQEDQANYQRRAEWLARRNDAMKQNSMLESTFGNAVNDLRQNADMANMQTRFGNRQQFYKNLGLLGQDSQNQFLAGLATIHGTESGGTNSTLQDQLLKQQQQQG